MIRINLLPFRAARKQENIRRQITIFGTSVLMVVLALIYFNGTMNDKIRGLEDYPDPTWFMEYLWIEEEGK